MSYGERWCVINAASRSTRLSPLALRVLIQINDHLNSASGQARISQARTAERLGSTRSRICLAITELETAGFIWVDRTRRQRTYGLLRQQLTDQPGAAETTGRWVPEPAPIAPERVPEPEPIAAASGPRVPEPETQRVPDPEPLTCTPGTCTAERAAPAQSARPPTPPKPADPEISLPEDWRPTEAQVTGIVTALGVDAVWVQSESDDFRHHYLGKPSLQFNRSGWFWRWRKWLERAARPAASYGPGPRRAADPLMRPGNLGLVRPLSAREAGYV